MLFPALGHAGGLLTWKAVFPNWREGTTPFYLVFVLEFELFSKQNCVKKEKKGGRGAALTFKFTASVKLESLLSTQFIWFGKYPLILPDSQQRTDSI